MVSLDWAESLCLRSLWPETAVALHWSAAHQWPFLTVSMFFLINVRVGEGLCLDAFLVIPVLILSSTSRGTFCRKLLYK